MPIAKPTKVNKKTQSKPIIEKKNHQNEKNSLINYYQLKIQKPQIILKFNNSQFKIQRLNRIRHSPCQKAHKEISREKN